MLHNVQERRRTLWMKDRREVKLEIELSPGDDEATFIMFTGVGAPEVGTEGAGAVACGWGGLGGRGAECYRWEERSQILRSAMPMPMLARTLEKQSWGDIM